MPRESLRYLLLCLAGLAAFILLAIYPNQQTIAELDLKIAKLQRDIQEQEILAPVYRDLLTQLRTQERGPLPLPEKREISREGAGRISSLFKEAAEKSGLRLTTAVPDVASLGEEPSGLLSVRLALEGDFFDFRNFLVRLGEIPHLEHIEEIEIESRGRRKGFSLKVWLAMKEDKASTG